MVSVEDRSLEGGGFLLKQSVWDAARTTIEEWTGQRLAECSLYGIRIYEEGRFLELNTGFTFTIRSQLTPVVGKGAVLATHVDRLPLVSRKWEVMAVWSIAIHLLLSCDKCVCR